MITKCSVSTGLVDVDINIRHVSNSSDNKNSLFVLKIKIKLNFKLKIIYIYTIYTSSTDGGLLILILLTLMLSKVIFLFKSSRKPSSIKVKPLLCELVYVSMRGGDESGLTLRKPDSKCKCFFSPLSV